MQKSIAVLPFKNRSADPENEYFSDGITEEIINALAQIRDLKVTARTSSFAFKNQQVDIREIGNQLGVRTILEGSIRKAQNRVRITAQLINVEDGYHLFSKTYERELKDIFALQDEISLLIADQLREELGHLEIQEQLFNATTSNVEAYELYLKGRHEVRKWSSEQILQGFNYLNKAIELQPDFALPHLELDHGYTFMGTMGLLPAKQAFELGLKHIAAAEAIHPGLPEIYLGKASHSFWYEWNTEKALEHLRKAIQLRPNYPDAFYAVAISLMYQGLNTTANEWLEKAMILDPLSHMPLFMKGMNLYWAHEFDASIAAMEETILLNPDSFVSYLVIGLCHLSLGRLEEGIKVFETMPALPISLPDRIGGVALGKLLKGDQEAGREGVRRLNEEIPNHLQNRGLIWKACLYTQLGEKEKAMDLVEEGIEARFGLVLSFPREVFLEPLLRERRFQQLMMKAMQNMQMDKNVFAKYQTSNLSEQQSQQWYQNLQCLMEEDKVYLNPNLNLRGLAKQLSIHPNQLSQLINEQTGKNFNRFINTFRLQYFIELAMNPAYEHLSLLGMAYESGFKSKTVFNTFFKKEMGMTPSQYLKQSLDSTLKKS